MPANEPVGPPLGGRVKALALEPVPKRLCEVEPLPVLESHQARACYLEAFRRRHRREPLRLGRLRDLGLEYQLTARLSGADPNSYLYMKAYVAPLAECSQVAQVLEFVASVLVSVVMSLKALSFTAPDAPMSVSSLHPPRYLLEVFASGVLLVCSPRCFHCFTFLVIRCLVFHALSGVTRFQLRGVGIHLTRRRMRLVKSFASRGEVSQHCGDARMANCTRLIPALTRPCEPASVGLDFRRSTLPTADHQNRRSQAEPMGYSPRMSFGEAKSPAVVDHSGLLELTHRRQGR